VKKIEDPRGLKDGSHPSPTISIITMIVLLLAYLAGWLYAAFLYTPIRPFEQFPEIARGHTCVHLDQDNTFPAYMVLERGEPVFYDLWTNRTLGSYYDYTGQYIRSRAFHKIRMTSPVYWKKTLYEVLTHPKQFKRTVPPVLLKIYEKRKEYWWMRCVRHYQEFRERRLLV
jgi:hypothetical protein